VKKHYLQAIMIFRRLKLIERRDDAATPPQQLQGNNSNNDNNYSNALVAQLAERRVFLQYENENKSPRWDLNPRPKVSALPLRDERGIK
jgi:hypothetical protein